MRRRASSHAASITRPAVYTVPEVARILRVSRGVIYRAVEDGVIPVIDFGPDRRPLRILARWLDEQLAPDFERYPPLSASSIAGDPMKAAARQTQRSADSSQTAASV